MDTKGKVTFKEWINEARKVSKAPKLTSKIMNHHVDEFFDISSSGPDHDSREHLYKKHASTIHPTHRAQVHAKMHKEMTKEGSFSDNEKKDIMRIYKKTKYKPSSEEGWEWLEKAH